MDIEVPEELTAYLRATKRVGADEALTIQNLAGGVSNRTVYVRRASGEAWVLKQALAKLRVQVDWFSDPARVDREALGIEWLGKLLQAAPPAFDLPHGPPSTPGQAAANAGAAAAAMEKPANAPATTGRVPALIFHDPEHHLLAMEAVPEPHQNFKTVLLHENVPLFQIGRFGQLLADVHGQSFLRLSELPAPFRDRRYFQNLRLEPYYQYTAEQVPEAAAFLRNLVASTNMRKLCLVHGDYSPKNVLLQGGGLVLLDHEVIHIGDPAFDLGFALTHLLSKALHRPDQRGQFLLAAHLFYTHYLIRLAGQVQDERWVVETETWAVRHALGCLLARVAGRSQLEYLTPDEKLKQRVAVTTLMENQPATVEELALKFGTRIQ